MKKRNIKLNPVCAVLAALLLIAPWPVSVLAQQQEQQQQNDQSSSASQSPSTKPEVKSTDGNDAKPDTKPEAKAGDADAKPAANQAMTPEEARQAQFVADSQKLYQLAQELKAEVAKSDKNTLSIAVTKKAEEIEKLAKSMKERMRKE